MLFKKIYFLIVLFKGPSDIPFLGNVIDMIKAFKEHSYPFTYFAGKYGEIYRLKIPFDEIGEIT